MSAPAVVALIATFRRAPEVVRLLASLEKIPSGLRAAVLVDNGQDPATQAATEGRTLAVEYVAPGENLGCGGGLALAGKQALASFGDELTHFWILDDDAVVAPDTLAILLAAMAAENADLAHPLVVDVDGQLGWFPGLLDREKFRAVREPGTPEQFLARCGAAPVPFSWAQGIALLVSRRAIGQFGWHRTDYWVRGEDLEFSLRLTHRFRGIYVPAARVQHLPPAPLSTVPGEDYRKHRAMLQNIAYTALRLPHGRRIARTIPGNSLRFLRAWGWKPRVLADAVSAFFCGAVLGKPAGVK